MLSNEDYFYITHRHPEKQINFTDDQKKRIKEDFKDLLMRNGSDLVADELCEIVQNYNRMVKMLKDIEGHYQDSSRGIKLAGKVMSEISSTIENRTHIAGQ